MTITCPVEWVFKVVCRALTLSDYITKEKQFRQYNPTPVSQGISRFNGY